MAEQVKLVDQGAAKLFSPEAGLLRQVLVYSQNLMLVRHVMEKGGSAPDTAIRTSNWFT